MARDPSTAKTDHQTGRPVETDIEATPATLRNPNLAPRYDGGPGRPIGSGERITGADVNGVPNGQGFWLHDEAGARDYVPRETPDFDADALIAGIRDRFDALAGFDAGRVDVEVTGGSVILTGRVPDAEARRRAGASAVAVAGGVPVANRLTIEGHDR